MLKQRKTVYAMMGRKLMKEPGKLILVTEKNESNLNLIRCRLVLVHWIQLSLG